VDVSESLFKLFPRMEKKINGVDGERCEARSVPIAALSRHLIQSVLHKFLRRRVSKLTLHVLILSSMQSYSIVRKEDDTAPE
jgi:hypothetical protein